MAKMRLLVNVVGTEILNGAQNVVAGRSPANALQLGTASIVVEVLDTNRLDHSGERHGGRMPPNGPKLSDRGWPSQGWNSEPAPWPASVRWSALLGDGTLDRVLPAGKWMRWPTRAVPTGRIAASTLQPSVAHGTKVSIEVAVVDACGVANRAGAIPLDVARNTDAINDDGTVCRVFVDGHMQRVA